MRECKGVLRLADPYVGQVIVDNAVFFACEQCAEKAYPLDTARKIEVARQAAITKLVSEFPISEFVTSRDAAGFLGVTRQAMSKNRRIKRGFVYKVKMADGCTMYLLRSLRQFKETLDGRFPLFRVYNIEAPQYAGYSPKWKGLSGRESTIVVDRYSSIDLESKQETIYARQPTNAADVSLQYFDANAGHRRPTD